jgi:hypothetical protein
LWGNRPHGQDINISEHQHLWRNDMKISVKSGATIAATAAALVLGGALAAPSAAFAAEQGKCFGANACKGQSACKTAKSECKGHNACKGQGFKVTTKGECIQAKGKFEKI